MKIKITKPCTASWDAMSIKPSGRLCAQCDKVVVDFTTFSDEKLIEYLSKRREKVCGRLEGRQLNRELHKSRSSVSVMRKLMTFILATAASLRLVSQSEFKDECGQQIARPPVQSQKPKNVIVMEKGSERRVPFAILVRPSTNHVWISDSIGEVDLDIDSIATDSVHIHSVGYKMRKISVLDLVKKDSAVSADVIEIELSTSPVLGALIIESSPPFPRRIINSIRDLIRRNED